MVFNSHGALRSVLLCKPDYYEICDFSEVASQHIKEGFVISREAAFEQHKEFVEVFQQLGVDVKWQVARPGHPDQVATRDFGVNTVGGVLIGNFRYEDNEGDTELAVKTLEQLKVPMIGRVMQGSLEGGDCWYLDKHTIVIGTGNRTTMEGIKEAEKILRPFDIKVIPIQFEEKWNHLDMIFSVVAEKTVMLCPEALPEHFLKYLKNEKYEIINIPGREVFAGTINLLALGKERILSFQENKFGNERLKAIGLEVYDPHLSQFLLGGSGPHCLSFEIVRE
ncbi:MAG: arginine deiminase family protein [Candidatus Caldatribacteriota bacterium]|nr:arginine deiminase family protein [Candidatus Caldatribacteriota bacterium]